MSFHITRTESLAGQGLTSREVLPDTWLALRQRVRTLSFEVRSELEPILEEAIEEARCRGRVMNVARDALARLRLELAMTRFDLDATRREREDLRRLLESR